MEKASGMRKDGEMAGGKMAKLLGERRRNVFEERQRQQKLEDLRDRWRILDGRKMAVRAAKSYR